MQFGKYRGRRISSVLASDPKYILWLTTIATTRRYPRLWAAVKTCVPRALELIDLGDQRLEQEHEDRRRAVELRRWLERIV